MKIKLSLLCASLVFISACTQTKQANSLQEKQSSTHSAMVVTANPHATKAGAAILRAGGSAVDAAIAIEAVLSLVEPQSSGLGGGGFMVYYDNQSQNLSVYDGRETAPASATPDLFIDEIGKPFGFIKAKTSGISTGVPGMISMLNLAHQDHGLLSWGPHFDYAKNLASKGFAVSQRLHGMIERYGKYLPNTPEQGPIDAYKYLHTSDNKALPVGHILKNPDYANSLDLIAADPAAFYQGDIAKDIVNVTAQSPRAGSMTLSDLASFSAKKRNALCTAYKGMQVCGPPPPSSWLAVGMIMGVLEKGPAFSNAGADDPNNWSLFAQAQRLAYADRDKYVADSDSVIVPVKGLIHQDYLALRANQLFAKSGANKVMAGDPWAFNDDLSTKIGKDATLDIAGTTHFVVVDNQGNVVSMTASVESVFGSTRMAGGMLLNNQLTDFSFKAIDDQGLPIANAVSAGKRPRSSMSPTIVLNPQGEFLMATGSPGGNSIIAYTAKTLVGVFDWNLSPQQAINLPNLVARGDTVKIESSRANPSLIDGLRSNGFTVAESSGENSGLSVVYRHSDGRLEGGVDPRREGTIELITD